MVKKEPGEDGDLAVAFSRRAFLKSTLAGSAALAAGAILPSGCASYPESKTKLQVLSGKEAAILAALARVIVGNVGELPDPVESGAISRLDSLLAQLPEEIRQQFSLLLNFFEHAPPLFGKGISRFTKLSPQKQERYLLSWRDSSLSFRKMAFGALKMFVQLAYYAGDATWKVLGYDGPWVGRIPIDPIVPPLAHDKSRVPSGKGSIREGSSEKGDLEISCEVLIVGSGAGGAVAARELAEAGFDVVVLEEGGHWPSSSFTQREEEMVPRLYREGGGRATADLSIPILQGRVLGGSTVHNICLSYRIEPAILERWKKEYAVAFTEKDLAPLAERVEASLGVNPIQRWQVNQNNEIFAKGCEKRGVQWEIPRHNRIDCLMCGFCDQGCAYDRKQSMLITYIPRAVDAGARIFSDCRVDKILMDRSRALGVEGARLDRATSEPKGRLRVKANYVVLSASAIDSALLLQRSGAPDESGRLGNSLHIHPYAAVAALYDNPVEAWRGIPQSALSMHYAKFREAGYGGYLLIPGWAHPGMAATIFPGIGKEHFGMMREYAHAAGGGVMIHDETHGRIGDFPIGKRARIDYWPEEEDRETLQEGIKNLAKIYLASGAKKVALPYQDGPFAATDAEVDEIVNSREARPHNLLLTAVHPQSSCPMGEDKKKSVLNSFGRLHGLENLYVADGSVFPTSIGTPPTIAIATLSTWIARNLAEAVKRG